MKVLFSLFSLASASKYCNFDCCRKCAKLISGGYGRQYHRAACDRLLDLDNCCERYIQHSKGLLFSWKPSVYDQSKLTSSKSCLLRTTLYSSFLGGRFQPSMTIPVHNSSAIPRPAASLCGRHKFGLFTWRYSLILYFHFSKSICIWVEKYLSKNRKIFQGQTKLWQQEVRILTDALSLDSAFARDIEPPAKCTTTNNAFRWFIATSRLPSMDWTERYCIDLQCRYLMSLYCAINWV